MVSISINWESPFLHPQKRISFEPTTTYLLKDLKPFTTYTFRLAARSKHGVGAYTNEISAETPQTRRSSSLSDCSFNSLSFSREAHFQMHLFLPHTAQSDKYKYIRMALSVDKAGQDLKKIIIYAFENMATFKFVISAVNLILLYWLQKK